MEFIVEYKTKDGKEVLEDCRSTNLESAMERAVWIIRALEAETWLVFGEKGMRVKLVFDGYGVKAK